jgi:hypothetical protein
MHLRNIINLKQNFMKNLLLILAVITLTFQSCSSDDDSDDGPIIVECVAATNLSVSGINTDSAILNWDNSNDGHDVKVEYGATGFSPGSGTVISSFQNSISIDGLIPDTSYDFYVQAICAVDNTSTLSAVSSFTTNECNIPINLSVSEITEASAVLNWENNNDNLAVNIEYGLTGFTPGDGTVISASQNSISIDELTSDTAYDFYVQASCTVNNEQSEVGTFTTNECQIPMNLSVSEIAADNAVLNWENLNDNLDVNVEYGLTGFTPGDGTVISVSENSISIDGLTPDTSYDFYVQATCSVDNSQSEVSTFTTNTASPFVGTWNGTYDGGDTGTWTLVVDVNSIITENTYFSNNANQAGEGEVGVTIPPCGCWTDQVDSVTGLVTSVQFTGDNYTGTWVNPAVSATFGGNMYGSRE